MFDLENELKKLPHKPGVYLMHNRGDQVIYVGKAIDLYNRVHQYFQAGYKRSAKIEKMVSHIAWFEYIICGSEVEALVLECNLIKEHRPKYNTMLTDDKAYPYIRITLEEEFPRVLYSHQMHRDGSKYFGPYTNARAVKEIIDLIKKLYHLRCCSQNLPKEKTDGRACLYYHIGQCNGPCLGLISADKYKENVQQAIRFLNGHTKETVKSLEEKMRTHAEALDFEEAAKVRDTIEAIHHVTEKQRMANSGSGDKDIIAMATDEKDQGVISIFFMRDGKMIGREHFHMSGVAEENYSHIMAAFLKQYYASTPYLPKEILVENDVVERELIEKYLSERLGYGVRITTPQKGDKSKLLKLAADNARLVLNQDMDKLKREKERTEGAAAELANLIGAPSAKRLEAFDISHISGYHSVASMVVFEDGRPRKNEYRKFKLKTIDGPDDYASMKEVLTRRFTDEKFATLPDILMMDGGKGQVNVALEVLEELDIHIPVCGMVKDDHHRTRGLYYNNQEIAFPSGTQAFDMITRLQDEAHRFAIEYHRSLRSKAQVKSVLDDIPGIGPARRKALLSHFKDIGRIKEADVVALASAPGMTETSAKNVYEFFHGSDHGA